MVCPDCKSRNNQYDERMGERVCSDCGLVIVTEPFEQTISSFGIEGNLIRTKDVGLGTTTDGIPRHIKKGISFCQMALSSIAPQINLKDRVSKLYVDLHNKGVFHSRSLEDRASAVVFYALKENNTPYSLKEVCREYSCSVKSVNRIVRRINQVYGNKNCFTTNHEFALTREVNKLSMGLEFQNSAIKVLTRLESVIDDAHITRGRTYYACICWMTCVLTQQPFCTQVKAANKTGYSRVNIRKKTNELIKLLGFENIEQMKGKIGEI